MEKIMSNGLLQFPTSPAIHERMMRNKKVKEIESVGFNFKIEYDDENGTKGLRSSLFRAIQELAEEDEKS